MELFEDFGDLDGLAAQLEAEDSAARRVAVMGLADTADPAAVPLLISALRDPAAEVRLQAARRSASSTGRQWPQLWRRAGRHRRRRGPGGGRRSIGTLKDQEAAGPCWRPWPRAAPSSAAHPARAQGAAPHEALGPAVGALQRRRSRGPRAGRGRGRLAQARGGAAGPDRRLPATPSPAVRRAAVSALGFSRSPTPLEAAVAALDDPDWQVRETAAETLGEIGRTRGSDPAHGPAAGRVLAGAAEGGAQPGAAQGEGGRGRDLPAL